MIVTLQAVKTSLLSTRHRAARLAGANIFREFTVLDHARPDPKERVAALVRRLLTKRAIDRPVGPDDDLGASGLSSLDIVNLMLSVEAEFGVKIPDRDMTPTNFRSIARIDALVRGLRAA